MSVYWILNYPVNYPDTNMTAGNCQRLTGASSPFLGEWEVAASHEDVPPPITRSLYVTVVHTKNHLDPLWCLATIHERYRQTDRWIYCGTDLT